LVSSWLDPGARANLNIIIAGNTGNPLPVSTEFHHFKSKVTKELSFL
jgi:hypothetical protein